MKYRDLIDGFYRYEGLDEEVISMMNKHYESSTTWYMFHVIVNLIMVLGLSVLVKRIAIRIESRCVKKEYLHPFLYIACIFLPTYISVAFICFVNALSWIERCVHDKFLSKKSSTGIYGTLGLFLSQCALASFVNISKIIYGFIFYSGEDESPSFSQEMDNESSSFLKKCLDVFLIHPLMGYQVEDFKAWCYCQIFLVCIPCFMLTVFFDQKKGNERTILSFGASFVAFLVARRFPLHIMILAVSAHITLLLGSPVARIEMFLQRRKNQQQKKDSTAAKPNASTPAKQWIWQWSDNNKWFPYLKADSDKIEMEYQALMKSKDSVNVLGGLWKKEVNSRTFVLSIAGRGNYNVTIDRAGAGT